MIAVPTGVRVWLAAGHTDMRRGMQGLARQVQETLATRRRSLRVPGPQRLTVGARIHSAVPATKARWLFEIIPFTGSA
jgi:hypothetical protein